MEMITMIQNLEGKLYDVENGLNQFWLFSYGFPSRFTSQSW